MKKLKEYFISKALHSIAPINKFIVGVGYAEIVCKIFLVIWVAGFLVGWGVKTGAEFTLNGYYVSMETSLYVGFWLVTILLLALFGVPVILLTAAWWFLRFLILLLGVLAEDAIWKIRGILPWKFQPSEKREQQLIEKVEKLYNSLSPESKKKADAVLDKLLVEEEK